MRYLSITLATVGFLVPVPAQAQIDRTRVPAGGTVVVTRDCAAVPALQLEGIAPLTAVGTTPEWSFTLPSTAGARTYAAVFRCPSESPTDVSIGSLEVTAVGPPHVLSVTNMTTGDVSEVPLARLKNVLALRVANVEPWRKANPQATLHLFLAGVELENVIAAPTARAVKDPPELFAFRLTPEVDDTDADMRKAWVQVLKAAKRGDPIEVALGPAGQAPFTSDARIRVDVYPTYRTWGVLGLFLVIAYFIYRLGRTSFMLRDDNGSANPPYSLARHQMAIWFVVVVGAYLYIWVTTGLFSWVSTTALALIGISGATGLVAVGIDSSKRADAVNARVAFQGERDALHKTLNDPVTGLQAQLAAVPAGSPQALELTASIAPKLARLNELNALLNTPVPAPHSGRGWVKDLVSDDNGVSFHRVQMVVWTVVLVVVFVLAVRDDVLMPEFETTLLALMGISSGTYIGFKFPEKAG